MAKINIDKNDVSKKVAVDIVSKAIWAVLYAFFTTLAAIIFSLLKKVSVPVTISVISIIISIIALIIMVVFLRKNSKGNTSQNSASVVPNFKATTIEAEFYFASREEMESRIEYNMQLTCPSMREYPRDLVWSGSEYKGTTIAPEYAEDYEIDEYVGPQSPHDYLIKFKTEKKRGDTIKFKTITQVGDTTHIMKTMYSYTVKYQIDQLVLRLSVPKGLVKGVKKAVYADRGREIIVEEPTKITKKIVGDLEEYTFTCSNPTLLYNYFIEWQFTNP
ncbi:MAG: hypothetical protein HDT15_11540 [Oscillibacter sp.]|nr:hypothetical protein [Oscillibacter sp.]